MTRLPRRLPGIPLARQVPPHPFRPRPLRRWLCRNCYAPRSRHPRDRWAIARTGNAYLPATSPHFDEGY